MNRIIQTADDVDRLRRRVDELEKTVALLSSQVDLLVRAHPKINYGRFKDEA